MDHRTRFELVLLGQNPSGKRVVFARLKLQASTSVAEPGQWNQNSRVNRQTQTINTSGTSRTSGMNWFYAVGQVEDRGVRTGESVQPLLLWGIQVGGGCLLLIAWYLSLNGSRALLEVGPG